MSDSIQTPPRRAAVAWLRPCVLVAALLSALWPATAKAGISLSPISTGLDFGSQLQAQKVRGVVGRAIHVQAGAADLLGDPQLRIFRWSFGDANAAYNDLNGFNAAHVYATPGIYPVRLNGRVVTQAIVRAEATLQPVRTGEQLKSVLEAGGSALLPPGVLVLNATIAAVPGATVQGSAGGSSQLYWEGSAQQAMITAWQGGLTVRDVIFTSAYDTAVGPVPPDAIRLGGSDNTVLGCRFLNINTAVNGNGQPDGTLVQGCSVNGTGDLRSYLVWGEGRRWTILGNRCPNSTRETPVRLSAVGGANCAFVLMADNDLANIERPGVDPGDSIKAAIKAEFVDFCWAEGNVFGGVSEAGPLGNNDGLPSAARRASYLVWRNNLHRGPVRLKHGLQHFLMEGSRIDYLSGSLGGWLGGLSVEGYDAQYNRSSSDLVVRGNVLTTPRRGERQIAVLGRVDGRLEFAGNTLTQGFSLAAMPGKASVAAEGGWLANYSSHDNTFPAAGGHGWPDPLAVVQVGDQNDPSSYLEESQWLSLPGVLRDRFVNVPLP